MINRPKQDPMDGLPGKFHSGYWGKKKPLVEIVSLLQLCIGRSAWSVNVQMFHKVMPSCIHTRLFSYSTHNGDDEHALSVQSILHLSIYQTQCQCLCRCLSKSSAKWMCALSIPERWWQFWHFAHVCQCRPNQQLGNCTLLIHTNVWHTCMPPDATRHQE